MWNKWKNYFYFKIGMHGKKPGREFSMYGGTAMQKQPGENTVHMSYEIMTSFQQFFSWIHIYLSQPYQVIYSKLYLVPLSLVYWFVGIFYVSPS